MMPKIVCSSIVEKDGRYLLVKENKDIAKGRYSFPQGSLEEDEDIFEGVIRETKEETGLDVKLKDMVGIYQRPNTAEGNNITVFVFRGSTSSGYMQKSDKHPEVGFFSYDEIKILDKEDRLRSPYMIPALEDYIKGNSTPLSFLKVIRD